MSKTLNLKELDHQQTYFSKVNLIRLNKMQVCFANTYVITLK
jgi:hypothetical protein